MFKNKIEAVIGLAAAMPEVASADDAADGGVVGQIEWTGRNDADAELLDAILAPLEITEQLRNVIDNVEEDLENIKDAIAQGSSAAMLNAAHNLLATACRVLDYASKARVQHVFRKALIAARTQRGRSPSPNSAGHPKPEGESNPVGASKLVVRADLVIVRPDGTEEVLPTDKLPTIQRLFESFVKDTTEIVNDALSVCGMTADKVASMCKEAESLLKESDAKPDARRESRRRRGPVIGVIRNGRIVKS